MTSQKQTEANRRNALLSTGPRTETGKQRARQNALRHGLTAETVIAGLEDAVEYGAFEAEIVAEHDPQSVVERELTRRLASLLWRLRRANLIETGLLSIDTEIGGTCRGDSDITDVRNARMPDILNCWLRAAANSSDRDNQHNGGCKRNPGPATDCDGSDDLKAVHDHRHAQRTITQSFLRITNLANQPFERLSRYEATLWRQFVQVLFSLDQAKCHRIAASRGRFTLRTPQW